MNTLPLHPLHGCWDLAASAIRAEALDTALALNLFDALVEPLTAAELASRQDLHAANTAHLLELLWSLGLLQRQRTEQAPDRYLLAPVARESLVRAAPGFCGDAWRYRLTSLRGLADRLRAHVEQGPQLPENTFQSATGAGWAAAARAQIGQEQRAVSAAGAFDIMDRLPQARQATRLLDLGGGPGWIAIELARRFPDLRGVVFDWPETAAVAQENIEASGLAERLCAQGGDVAADTLGDGEREGFDLVWCSSVLHFVPDIGVVLAKVMAAMAPGGLFVCVHAELPTTAEEAAQVMPFYLPMRMVGRHVLPEGGTAAALAEAGFVEIEQFASGRFPMSPVQVAVARKPQAPGHPKARHV
ncbi:class I SAM-dependent methyltransferase [Variovorax sp. GB1P17]|uniref:class I SAM-dependent methyltransferase n=1 Tax=Variovorax sp. GB1P17 TaxID=3443740 RepID=UPI003F489486